MNWRSVYLDTETAAAALCGRQPLCGPRILQLNVCDDCNIECIMCNRQRMAMRLVRAKTEYLSWCQHLGINRKLNRLNPRTWPPERFSS